MEALATGLDSLWPSIPQVGFCSPLNVSVQPLLFEASKEDAQRERLHLLCSAVISLMGLDDMRLRRSVGFGLPGGKCAQRTSQLYSSQHHQPPCWWTTHCESFPLWR